MTKRVLISAPYMQLAMPRFRAVFEERGIELSLPHVEERLNEEQLLPYVADIDGAICGDDAFTDRVLASAPKLKVIAKWGTGIDSIDRAACARRRIALRNTPNAFTEPVADSVLGYILAFARKLPWMDAELKRGGWTKIPLVSLAECTLGVIGVGNIGSAVSKRARGFGMTLLGVDPRAPSHEFLEQCSMTMVEQSELLACSDFVSINCDLNETSRYLMDEEAFARMKPGSVLINTARGPIVREEALLRALESSKVAGAALDVFETEPLALDSPFRRMRNVLVAPHNSNSSPRAWERVHLNTIRMLFEELGLSGT